jgi:hypothetical protein
MRVFMGALAALLLVTGCSQLPGFSSKAAATPSASASPTGSPLAKASGQLDAEVPMPPGFPADVPVYPKARLTAAASFVSTGQVAWGMEWETVDPPASVDAFYKGKLNSADWTLTVKSQTPALFAGTITRKNSNNTTGTLAINADGSLVTIAMSLLTSG